MATDPAGASGSGPEVAATARDLTTDALVLGVAAAAWFSWAQQGPPPGWEPFLLLGAGLGVVLVVAAVLVLVRGPRDGSAMSDEAARRRYGRAVGLEAGLIALGSVALGVGGRPEFISPWVLAVVGAHFVPLATVFRIPSLGVAGLLLVGVATVATLVGATTDVLAGAVSGGVGGLVLLGFGARALHQALARRSATTATT